MKVDINKLRHIIETRLVLLNNLEEETSLINKEKLKLQIKNLEKEIAQNKELFEETMKSFFMVSEDILHAKLLEFFKQKINFEEDCLTVSLKKVIIRIDGKLYVLWDKDDLSNNKKISLDFLYKRNKFFSWNELLVDYPELKDILWNAINETHNIQKYNKTKLIKRILFEKKQELDKLTNPEKLNQYIIDIQNEIKKEEDELKEIEPFLNQVEL